MPCCMWWIICLFLLSAVVKRVEIWCTEVSMMLIKICKLIDQLIRNGLKNYSFCHCSSDREVKIGRQEFSVTLITNSIITLIPYLRFDLLIDYWSITDQLSIFARLSQNRLKTAIRGFSMVLMTIMVGFCKILDRLMRNRLINYRFCHFVLSDRAENWHR